MCCEYWHPCKCRGGDVLCSMCGETKPVQGKMFCAACADVDVEVSDA
jgi:hypothetical protein